MERYLENQKSKPNIMVPQEYKKLSTSTILTSSFVHGDFILNFSDAD